MKAKRLRSFLCALGFVPILLFSPGLEAEVSAANWTQLSPTVSPSARSYVAMAYDIASRKILLFGGFGGAGYLNETWTFDGTTWTKVDTAIAPGPRTNAQMAYDRRTHKVVLFGGYDGSNYLDDTWLWDGRTSTWTQAAPTHSPTAVTGPMVFTDLNGRVDEFGGFSGNLYRAHDVAVERFGLAAVASLSGALCSFISRGGGGLPERSDRALWWLGRH